MNKHKTYCLVAIVAALLTGSVALRKALGNQTPAIPPCPETCATVIRNADEPARHAFQQQAAVMIPDGTNNGFAIINVPAGKQLVIENASGAADGITAAAIQTTVGGVITTHYLIVQQQSPSSLVYWGQPVRVYAGPFTGVVLQVGRNSNKGISNGVFAISGYLVDLP